MNAKEIKTTLKSARECLLKDQFGDAAAKCQVILEHDPENYMALAFLAKAHESQGHLDAALKAYRDAIDVDGHQILAWQGIVSFYEKNMKKQYEEELTKAYTVLLESFKEDWAKYSKVSLKLADLYMLQRMPQSALPLYVEIAEAEANSPTLAVLYKLIAASEALPEQTSSSVNRLQKSYRTVIEMQPDISPDLIQKYVRLYSKENNVAAVKDECARLHKIYPHYSIFVEYLIQIELETSFDGTDKAKPSPDLKDLVAKLERCDPKSHILCIAQGYIMLCEGDLIKAQALLQTVIKEAPGIVCTYAYLAQVYNRLHKYSHVDKLHEKGMELIRNQDGCTITKDTTSIQEYLRLELGYSLLGEGSQASLQKALDVIVQVVLCYVTEVEDSNSCEEMVLLINIHLTMGQLDKSQELLDDNQNIIPGNAKLSILGWMSHLRGDNTQAATMLEEAIKDQSDPKTDRYNSLYRLGYVYWCLSQDGLQQYQSLCFKTLLKAAKVDPYYCHTFLYLGRYYEDIQHDLQKASRCYQKSHDLKPGYEDCCIRLCDVLFSLDDLEGVQVLLTKIVQDQVTKGWAWAWLRMGLLQMRQRDFTAAISSLQSALRLDISDSHVWESLAEAYFRRGSYTAALKTFTKALELSENPVALFTEMTARRSQVSPSWAVVTVTSCTRDLRMIALTRQTLCLYKEAIADYNTILQADPNYVPALKGLGETHLLLAKQQLHALNDGRALLHCQSAVDSLAVAVRERREMYGLWKLLGDVCTVIHSIHDCRLTVPRYLLIGADTSCDLTRAQTLQLGARCYTQAIKLQHDTVSLWYDLALNYFHQSQLSHDADSGVTMATKSLRLLQKVVSQCPSVHTYWTALGTVAACSAIKNVKLAQHCFIKSVHVENNNVIAWAQLGVLYMTAGEKHLAHEAFNIAQSLDPSYVISWIGQALIAESVGHEDAMDLFRHTTELTNHVEGLLKYAHWVCKTVVDLNKQSSAVYKYSIVQMAAIPAAEAALAKYLGRIKDNGEAYNLNGMILERQGMFRSALDSYTRSVEILEMGENQEHLRSATINYARLLSKMGQSEEAKLIYTEGVDVKSFEDLTSLALVMYQAMDYLPSYQAYEAALNQCEHDTTKSQVYAAMGLVSYAYGEVEAAQSEFITSSQCDPTSHHSLLCLAGLAVIQRDVTLAEATLATLDEVTRDDSVALTSLPILLKLAILKNDVDLAVSSILHTLNLFPSDPKLLKLLSNFLLQYPTFAPPIADVLKSVQSSPISRDLSTVYHTSQSPRDVVRSAQRVFHLYPDKLHTYVTLLTSRHAAVLAATKEDNIQDYGERLTQLISDLYIVHPKESLPSYMTTYVSTLHLITLLMLGNADDANSLVNHLDERSNHWRELLKESGDILRKSTHFKYVCDSIASLT